MLPRKVCGDSRPQSCHRNSNSRATSWWRHCKTALGEGVRPRKQEMERPRHNDANQKHLSQTGNGRTSCAYIEVIALLQVSHLLIVLQCLCPRVLVPLFFLVPASELMVGPHIFQGVIQLARFKWAGADR